MTGHKNDKTIILSKLKINPQSGCMEWMEAVDHVGYGRAHYQGKAWAAHRLVYTLLLGEIPNGLFVLHRCDNPKCCNVKHLFLGTNQDNATDKANKKRSTFGEKNQSAKLTEDQVLKIRELFSNGCSMSELAKTFSVKANTVFYIVQGKLWKHLLIGV